jgi:hypothetical protein
MASAQDEEHARFVADQIRELDLLKHKRDVAQVTLEGLNTEIAQTANIQRAVLDARRRELEEYQIQVEGLKQERAEIAEVVARLSEQKLVLDAETNFLLSLKERIKSSPELLERQLQEELHLETLRKQTEERKLIAQQAEYELRINMANQGVVHPAGAQDQQQEQ